MYDQELKILAWERKRELRTAILELQAIQIEKQRAELLERQRFKEELRYRMRQNTTKYLIPKKKTPIALRRAAAKQQRLDVHVFTQRQMQLAQQIIDQMEGRNND